MTEIVKVQLPLATNDEEFDQVVDDLALIYCKGRRRAVHQRLDAATMIAMGDDVRAFFRAQYYDGQWTIGRRVRDQEW